MRSSCSRRGRLAIMAQPAEPARDQRACGGVVERRVGSGAQLRGRCEHDDRTPTPSAVDRPRAGPLGDQSFPVTVTFPPTLSISSASACAARSVRPVLSTSRTSSPTDCRSYSAVTSTRSVLSSMLRSRPIASRPCRPSRDRRFRFDPRRSVPPTLVRAVEAGEIPHGVVESHLDGAADAGEVGQGRQIGERRSVQGQVPVDLGEAVEAVEARQAVRAVHLQIASDPGHVVEARQIDHGVASLDAQRAIDPGDAFEPGEVAQGRGGCHHDVSVHLGQGVEAGRVLEERVQAKDSEPTEARAERPSRLTRASLLPRPSVPPRLSSASSPPMS